MSEELKKIFSYNPDISKNAYMNWRTFDNDTPYNLIVLAHGYRDAAKVLMKSILDDNSEKQADSLIFPICYSINQSIELYLKAILWKIETITNGKPCNYKKHDIQGLLNNLLGQIKRKEVKTKGLENRVKSLKEYINELYSYIKDDKKSEKDKKDKKNKKGKKNRKGKGKPKLDYARYPFDRDRHPFFYVVESGNVVIDIENLLARYDDMIDCLEGLYCKYDMELEGMMSNG